MRQSSKSSNDNMESANNHVKQCRYSSSDLEIVVRLYCVQHDSYNIVTGSFNIPCHSIYSKDISLDFRLRS